ncbi:PIN domain-like protein [Hanseniaspora valbyensis NRRL Y-1626]|uniref:PIN domain-like protein n=1 Tax=Hanseniaspora valbyensis NRRL Y-1626 TaxID=766949 RepID=A0A1B7TCS8_9ASCO|nr:PIN domain-like protein [Hanseniaspora valbyensis NRRL Y-1626]
MGVDSLFDLISETKKTHVKKLYRKKVAIDLEHTIERASNKFQPNSKENLQVVFKQILQLNFATDGIIVILDGLFKPHKLRHQKVNINKSSTQDSLEIIFKEYNSHKKTHIHDKKTGCISSAIHNKVSKRYSEIVKFLDMLGINYFFNCSEAELLCSQLNRSNVVNFVVSEDSDVLIFGGTSIMRNYINLSNKNKFDDANYEYDYLEVSEDKFGFFLVAALLQGGDYAAGVEGVGIGRIKKLYKSPEFIKICSQLINIKNDIQFEDQYNEWVLQCKTFIKKNGSEIFSKKNSIVKNIDSIKFPAAVEVYKYRFTPSLDVQKLCLNITSSKTSKIYENPEDMKYFLKIFSKNQLLQLGLIENMKKELFNSKNGEWLQKFKIIKEYDSDDKDGPGYFIRYKNFFIQGCVLEEETEPEEEENLSQDQVTYNLAGTFLPSPKKRIRLSPTRQQKKEFPYEIRLTKERVWDDLWPMVEEWDLRKETEQRERESPKKKLKLSPIKQTSTLFSLAKSPIRKKIDTNDDCFKLLEKSLEEKRSLEAFLDSEQSDADSSIEIINITKLSGKKSNGKDLRTKNNYKNDILDLVKKKQNTYHYEKLDLNTSTLLKDLKTEEISSDDSDIIVLSD